jgi:cytochrome c-type biogenesis protein CcmH
LAALVVIVTAIHIGAIAPFLIASVIAGIAQGATFAGSLRALLAEATPGAPWVPVVEARLAEAGQAVAQSPNRRPEARALGPSAEQMAAANAMDEAARREMIQGMVARLAERLKTETQDVEGWLRLVRAYAVLDERDKARAATEAARRALGDESARARIDALARDLGLDG